MEKQSKQYKTSAQLKNAAKDSLTGNYGNAILILFLNSVLLAVISFFISGFSFTGGLEAYSAPTAAVLTVLSFLISLAFSVVLGVFRLGLSLFFLNMACGRPCAVSNLFYGFRHQSDKALILSGVFVLADTICSGPSQLFMNLYFTSLDAKWLPYFLISTLIGQLIYIPISLSLSQCFYLLLDFPEKSAVSLLKLSIQIMKGHKWRLFFIELSFLPLMFLCLLSFGIGFLWVTPYMLMTETHFFLDRMKPA